MNLSNTKLDINFVRSQFPAFMDPICKEWSFFENAGGSYVPEQVIEKLNEFMISTKVQPYAEYPMSKTAGNNMDKATEYFAKMINANSKEILIGGSTSINLYVLSNALKYSLKPGDEVIVTNQDHEANISPWRRLKEEKDERRREGGLGLWSRRNHRHAQANWNHFSNFSDSPGRV